jgi:hypothetical protein
LTFGDHLAELPNVHLLHENRYALKVHYKMANINVMVAYNKCAKNSSENSVKEQRDGILKVLQEEVTLDVSTALSLSASFSETYCSIIQSRNVESDQVLARYLNT